LIKTHNKLFTLILLAALILLFLAINIWNLNKTSPQFSIADLSKSDFIDDEIPPYCQNLEYIKSNETNLENLEKLNVDIVNKERWFNNLFNIIEKNDVFIFEENKNRFDANIEAIFNNGVKCNFDAKIRISGDFQDHLRNLTSTSLDVKLQNGNIGNIVNFKLFLPETKRNSTEFVVTSIMEKLNFLTPRTIEVISSVNNQKEINYIFQEKIAKEFLENNSLRESTLIETFEGFLWEGKQLIESDDIPIFGKILNEKWANMSKYNQLISLEGLSRYNHLILQSDVSYLSYEIEKEKQIHLFDTALYALDGTHGLATHNRKFYFDKFSNSLLPIYYDSDSQLTLRETKITSCSENLKTEHEKLACTNKFSIGATELLSKIDFDSNDLFEHVTSKSKNVEKEFVDEVYQTFLSNLSELSKIGTKSNEIKKNPYKNFQNRFAEDINNNFVGFYLLDLENSKFEFCNFIFTECIQKDSQPTTLSNIIQADNKTYHLFTNDWGSKKIKHIIYTDREITKDVTIRMFNTPSTVNVSTSNKTIFIEMNENSKILIFGKGQLRDWSIKVLGYENNPISEYRQDNNLLTGCITFLNLEVYNLDIETKNNKCEDAINLINVTGSINSIYIEDSEFDALDIDFSNLQIGEIEVFDAGNDCIDFSFSQSSIENLFTSECIDKSISIGENSQISFDRVESSDSKILLAVKDSSKVNIGSFKGQNVHMCVAMYRKKQEFGPSILKLKNDYCIGKYPNFIQNGQELKLES
tara:strand:- start:19220 stop:21484 length:2265 start_codon:yes stop_codon:yes gene_type:complete